MGSLYYSRIYLRNASDSDFLWNVALCWTGRNEGIHAITFFWSVDVKANEPPLKTLAFKFRPWSRYSVYEQSFREQIRFLNMFQMPHLEHCLASSSTPADCVPPIGPACICQPIQMFRIPSDVYNGSRCLYIGSWIAPSICMCFSFLSIKW